MTLLIMLYIIFNIGISGLILRIHLDEEFETPFPFSIRGLYEITEMNIFGCFIFSVIIIILSSVYHIPAFICWFVYKIFHVGRKMD